jgi:hypothetical protein
VYFIFEDSVFAGVSVSVLPSALSLTCESFSGVLLASAKTWTVAELTVLGSRGAAVERMAEIGVARLTFVAPFCGTVLSTEGPVLSSLTLKTCGGSSALPALSVA